MYTHNALYYSNSFYFQCLLYKNKSVLNKMFFLYFSYVRIKMQFSVKWLTNMVMNVERSEKTSTRFLVIT